MGSRARTAGQALVELSLVLTAFLLLVFGGTVLLTVAITAFGTSTAVDDLGRRITATGSFDAATEADFISRAGSLGAPVAAGLDTLVIEVDDGTTTTAYTWGDTISDLAYGDLVSIRFSRRLSVGGIERLVGLAQPRIEASFTGIAQRNGSTTGGGETTRPGTIVGRVRDAESNAPVGGAIVRVSGGVEAVSGIDGAFQLSPVDAGSRTLSVTAGGYRDGSATVTVPASGVANAAISLRPAATITVTLAGGQTGATVVTSAGLLATEVGGGVYRLAVPAGVHTVVAYAGSATGSGTVSVAAGGAAALTITVS